MSKHIQWLMEQIEVWVARGLISREQADGIRRLYPEPKAGLPWGAIIFSGIGAVILGLGVILLFAYNWEAMPKAAKLAVIFAALAGAHGTGLALFRCDDWRRQIGEAVCLLGTMLFGAGIWLVAQVYHIDEHYPNGFLIWGLGAMAMAWAMPSLSQGLLAVVVLCIWNCSEAWHFRAATHWGPLLMLAGLGVLAWRQQWRLLLFVTLAGFVIALTANAESVRGSVAILAVLNAAAVFLAVEVLVRRYRWFPESAKVWAAVGWAAFLICLFILTFASETRHLTREVDLEETSEALAWHVYRWLPLATAMLAWGLVGFGWLARRGAERAADCPYEHWLVPLAAAACAAFRFVDVEYDQRWVIGSPFNLLALTLAAAWMARGCRDARLLPTVAGSLLLVALAWARYFDLFESLLARGVVFVLVGGLLLAEGIIYSRVRRRIQKEAGA